MLFSSKHEACKLSNETGNVAFDLATLEALGLQYEFDLTRVIRLCVAIVFVKQFFSIVF